MQQIHVCVTVWHYLDNVAITLGAVKVFQSSLHCSTLSLFVSSAEASCQFSLDTEWPRCKSGVVGGFACGR